jgi:hypothetical protein
MGPLPNVFNIKEKTHGVLAIKAEKKNNREGGEKREDATEKRKEKTEGERRELKRKKQGEKTRKTEKKTERIRGERKKTEGKQTERKQRTQEAEDTAPLSSSSSQNQVRSMFISFPA